MPIFENYTENGKLIQSSHELLSEKNIERYIEQYGIERAKGYLDALIDLSQSVMDCTNKFEEQPNHEIVEQPVPEHILREKIQDLYFGFHDSMMLVEKAVENATVAAGRKPDWT